MGGLDTYFELISNFTDSTELNTGEAGGDIQWVRRKPKQPVVYFDQLFSADGTQKLVEILFSLIFSRVFGAAKMSILRQLQMPSPIVRHRKADTMSVSYRSQLHIVVVTKL